MSEKIRFPKLKTDYENAVANFQIFYIDILIWKEKIEKQLEEDKGKVCLDGGIIIQEVLEMIK